MFVKTSPLYLHDCYVFASSHLHNGEHFQMLDMIGWHESLLAGHANRVHVSRGRVCFYRVNPKLASMDNVLWTDKLKPENLFPLWFRIVFDMDWCLDNIMICREHITSSTTSSSSRHN